jgi:hypothetical protein
MTSRLAASVFSLLTLVSMGLMSCSQKDEQKEKPLAVDELQGHWQSNCLEGQYNALTAKSALGITQKSLLFVDGKTATEVTTISSLKCDGADIEATVNGTFNRSSASSPELKAIDIKMDHYKAKPLTEFGVRVMNLAKWCGISDWAIGQERDVTNQVAKEKCFDTHSISTVYSVAGENLYFGKIGKMTSAAADRPTELQKNFYFTHAQE